LLSVLTVVAGMFTLLPATAYAQAGAHAAISAELNCTSATKVCFTLTVSTMDFPANGQDVSMTLLGHAKSDPDPNHFVAVSASQTVHLAQNLDGVAMTICFPVVSAASYDFFKLDIKAIGADFDVNGKTEVLLGPFSNTSPNMCFDVTTSSLPDGTVGTGYDQFLAAANGQAPVTWQVITGTLPNGLHLSSAGEISGTPTVAGPVDFTVQATDSTTPVAKVAAAPLSITIIKNPVITAMVSSKYPKSRYGWYRSPVTVTFRCTAGSAPLTGPCPGAVTLRHNGAAQMVSRTIHGTDGGIAAVVVSPVNIDRIPPQVAVTGVRKGGTYDAPGPARLACAASDSLSGLAGPCTLVIHQAERTLSWTASAADKAGNTATVTGKVRLIDYFVARAALVAGRFVVKVGKTYTVEAYILATNTAPKYVDAAPAGESPHPIGPTMRKIGPHLWAIRIAITAQMDKRYKYWVLGVLSGRKLHIIPVTLQR
jgi:hypothetical protein